MTLFDAWHMLKQMMDKHGGNSPCYFILYTVEDLQSLAREDHEFLRREYKINPGSFDEDPGEFVPLSGNQLKHIAEYMTKNYIPTKDYIVFNEAQNELPFD